jgi:heme A synthase
MKTQAYFRLAVFTLICTLSLVTLGGVVHNTGSSLACPDWPLCFGQVFPKMEGGVAIEHSHRLLGSWVGLCVIGLVYLSSKIRREFPALFKGSLLALFVVVFQGVLGGVTVLLGLSPLVSSAHLATSQLFLALLLWLCFTAGSGAAEASRGTSSRNQERSFQPQCLLTGIEDQGSTRAPRMDLCIQLIMIEYKDSQNGKNSFTKIHFVSQ